MDETELAGERERANERASERGRGCDVEAVLPTVLASVFLGSLLVGLTFYLLGKFRLAGKEIDLTHAPLSYASLSHAPLSHAPLSHARTICRMHDAVVHVERTCRTHLLLRRFAFFLVSC
eukprot:1833211-Pleurochrysis_carterae.AAC.1